MASILTEEEINLVRQSSLILSKTLAQVAKHIKIGVSLLELDKIAEDFILSNDAKPAFKGYEGFPNTLCISVNDAVVHGIPTNYQLKEGDIVSVDCGVKFNSFYSDSAYTFAVGKIDPEIEQLLETTKECLRLGVEKAVTGNRVGDISNAVQVVAEKQRYGIVRELVGHGVGKTLHEKPEVPNYGKPGSGPVLKDRMVIAIEPMINLGKAGIRHDKDGWTIKTADGKPSAHYEHTIVVRKGKPEVLTTFEYLESELKSNNG